MAAGDARIDEAAQQLSGARRERRVLDRLPESCRPVNDQEAIAVQRRTVELLDGAIGGWKCSLPQPRGVFAAPILKSTIHYTSPFRVNPVRGIARIEPEIAFVIAHDVLPRQQAYTESEVRGAIATTHVVIEILGGRYTSPRALPFAEFLADCLDNQGLFVGPGVTDALDQDLSGFKIKINSPEGNLLEHEGRHPNGHPLQPLVWLANFLSSRGEILKAGQVVTTGSYAGIQEVPLAMPLTVEFGKIGSLSVIFDSF